MNNFVFLIRAEIYKTEFFSTRISGPRASPLGLKSEPKKNRSSTYRMDLELG